MSAREAPVLIRWLVRSLLLSAVLLHFGPFANGAGVYTVARSQPAEFPIAAFPGASAESPAIHGRTVVWYDDRRGPTDVWGYDLASAQFLPLANYDHAQLIAAVSDQWVVYEDNRNGTWDIYATERATQVEIAVATGPHHQRFPRIWGNYIVYQDETARRDQSDVYLFEISTRTTVPLAVTPSFQGNPDVGENWAIWVDGRAGAWQLGIYHLATQTTSFRPIDCDDSCQPRLAGDDVVWNGWRTGNYDIYLYNLVTQVETHLYAAPGDQTRPVISDQLIVWEDTETYGNSNLFVYVRATGQSFPIALEPSRQIKAAVSGNTVVWQDNRHHKWEIYGWVWDGNAPELPNHPLPSPARLRVGAYPAGQLRLEWDDTSDGENGFVVQRADGVFSADWRDYATVPVNTTIFTDTETTIGQSYWYRVRAYHGQGASGYSNESYSTAVGNDLPNLDERYLHLLINETRMDPAAWGLPQLAPVNPVGWDVRLARSARAHALGMGNSGCCQGHVDLEGRGPGDRAAASGYPSLAAENLFEGQSGLEGMEAIHRGFLGSEGHRDNRLDPNTRHTAIGFAFGRYGSVVEVFSAGPPGAVVPPLPDGIAIPYTGTVATEFDFLTTFWNSTLQPPVAATVVIDGSPHTMSVRSGQPGRGVYHHRQKLPLGQHAYHFEFVWVDPDKGAQTTRLPEEGSFTGPSVRPFLPDLAVVALWADGVVAGYEGTITAALTNEGEISATDVVVQLYQGEPPGEGLPVGPPQTVALLEPGGSATLHFPWRPDAAGEQVVSVWIDAANAILESNEENNLRSTTVAVRESQLTWYVDGGVEQPGDGRTPATAFATIAAAFQSALPGDIVQVAPGLYPGTVHVPVGVHLAGSGAMSTTIIGTGVGTTLYAGNGSTVSGFTITGSGAEYWDAGVWVEPDDSTTLFNNHILGNETGIAQPCFWGGCTGAITVTHSLFSENRRMAIDLHTASSIINNTVVANRWGVHFEKEGGRLFNNIIANNREVGLSTNNSAILMGHNNIWNNGVDYQGVREPGPGAHSQDPRFVADGQGDYRLRPDSHCIDAGDPDPSFQDVDGSRNDMGAWGGPRPPDPGWPYPGALSVELSTQAEELSDGRWRVTYVVNLTSIGGAVADLVVVAGIPEATTYVPQSAYISHGTVVVAEQLTFQIGALGLDERATLTYNVITSQPVTTTTRFASPLTISWDGRSLTQRNEAAITMEPGPALRHLYLALILSERAGVEP